MIEEQDNPYPDDAAVFVRFPTTPPGADGYGKPSDWPWLHGEIIQRCGPDEWEVAVVDDRFAVLADGSEPPEDRLGVEVFYPKVFRDGEELMIRPDDGSTPDGPVRELPPNTSNALTRRRLAEDLELISTRLAACLTPVTMWSGVREWETLDDAARTGVGVPALYNLVTVLCQLCDLCIRLHHAGCASDHYTIGELSSARVLLLLSVRPDLLAAPRPGRELARPLVDTVDTGDTAGNDLPTAQLGSTAAEPVDDATWMAAFDAVMDFANPTAIEKPPSTPQ